MPADDYFVRHDLSHYAIEKILEYRNAFLGMLNSGMEFHDFEDRNKRMQIGMSNEAAHAECLANLFLQDAVQGKLKNFLELASSMFQTSFSSHKMPNLSMPQVEKIRNLLSTLLQQWNELPEEETMNLYF